MAKYHVYVPEVHYQTVLIEAASPEQAVHDVLNGNGEYLDDSLEFSHGLDVNEMEVKDLATGKRVIAEGGEGEAEEEED